MEPESGRLEGLAAGDAVYRTLFEQSAIGVARIEIRTGRFERVNGRFCEILRYSRDEIELLDLQTITHPEDQQSVRDVLEALRSGRCRELANEMRWLGNDGATICVELALFAGREPGEMPTYCFAIAADITQRRQAAEHLAVSERRYRAMIENSHDAVGLLSADGTLLYESPMAVQMLGFSPDERIGRNAFEWLHPEDGAEASRLFATLLSQPGSSVTGQFRFRHKDGSWRWLESSGTNLLADPVVNAIVMNYADVTDRNIALETTRREKLFIDTAINSLPGIFYVFDQTGQFRRWNHNFEQVSGYSADEVSRRHPLDFFDGPDRDLIASRIGEVFERGLSSAEAHLITKDGRRIPYFFTGHRFTSDGQHFVVGMGLDLTDRKRAEAALRESEKRLAYALGATTEGLWDWNIQTGVVHYSPQWIVSLGYSPEDVSPDVSFWRSIVHPEDWSAVTKALDEHIAGRTPIYVCENRLRFKSGGYRHNLRRGKVVEWDSEGRPLRMVGTDTDITERRRAEDARAALEAELRHVQKMESVGRLAGGIAHDFNNLLSGILGHADLALTRLPAGSSVREHLDVIKLAAERSASLTSQLLAFARKRIIAPRAVNLNDALLEAERLLRRVVPENVEVRTVLAAEAPMARVDPGQLSQVLMNLAINARDAMPRGGRLTLTAGTTAVDEAFARRNPEMRPGEYAVLGVSDTGAGLSEAARRHLFEPFFTTKEQGQGTGLGLATCYGIIKQHEGHIAVASEPDVGTTFEIYLPVAQGESQDTRLAASQQTETRGSETVLLCEDDELVRGLAAEALRERGYEVLVASEGQEALRIAAGHDGQIALLLTDVIMPGMSGPELAERLRATRQDLKVLFISGYSEDTISDGGVLMPGVNLLQKPFTPNVLAQHLRGVLDGIGS